MPPKRRNSGQRSAPKQFRCTGYGDCNMVFTRSEHLARHERKHTGEKPYKCIVEGCERMFSRFDNMMQHTQTHDKERKKTAPTEALPNLRFKCKKRDILGFNNDLTYMRHPLNILQW
ncbi:Putative Cys2His2 zinc finger developmental/cell cycle regulator, other [Rhizopus microsporus]|nr:Putative Cys2His2 zinc finger developmental/cell cycle regulator, other [Rhizopus microsporus]